MSKLSHRPQNLTFKQRVNKIRQVSCISCKKQMGFHAFVRHNDNRCVYWKRRQGIEVPRGSPGGWNRGLTKTSDPRVLKKANAMKEGYRTGKYVRQRLTSDIKKQYWNDCAFKFNVYDYPSLFDLSILEKLGWYHPTINPTGASRDHIISIAYGWQHNISAKVISHMANCQILSHSVNNKKNTECDMTLEQILEKINTMS